MMITMLMMISRLMITLWIIVGTNDVDSCYKFAPHQTGGVGTHTRTRTAHYMKGHTRKPFILSHNDVCSRCISESL